MKLARKILKGFARSRVFGCLARSVECLPLREKGLLRVLTYHRVGTPLEQPHLDPALISATPACFERQMNWLVRDFCPVSLSEVLEAVRGGKRLPRKSVMVTFDDAYRDFFQNAFPVIRKLNLPVTLFVPTSYPDADRCFWWDRLYHSLNRADRPLTVSTGKGRFRLVNDQAVRPVFREIKGYLKSLRHEELLREVDAIVQQAGECEASPFVMSWRELSEVARAGVELVPHTCEHPLLTRVNLERAEQEIVQSREVLRERIGRVQPAFSYPSGFFDSSIEETLRKNDFELCFTTVRGIANLAKDNPLQIRRINVQATTPDSLIRLQLWSGMRAIQKPMRAGFPEG